MNKTERIMLLEIQTLTSAIPNFKNNMDMAGYGSFRADWLQMQSYLQSLTYSLLMFGDNQEDKTFWKNDFSKVLKDAKEFVDFRKKENWNGNTNFHYSVSISGW